MTERNIAVDIHSTSCPTEYSVRDRLCHAQLSSVYTHLSHVTFVFLDPISSTYGYLTWEWQKAIRGYTHPLVFATLYKLLSCLHLDWPSLLVLLPRVVVQAPLAAAADYHVFKLASLLYGANVGWYAVSSSPHISPLLLLSPSSPSPPPPSSFLPSYSTFFFSSASPPFLPSLLLHCKKHKYKNNVHNGLDCFPAALQPSFLVYILLHHSHSLQLC